jgi:hypothetical protein
MGVLSTGCWKVVGSCSTDSPLAPHAEQKVKEMEGVWSKVQEEIQGLQAERAVLLAELEKLDLFLTKAQAHRVRLLRCAYSNRQSMFCRSRGCQAMWRLLSFWDTSRV